jgi:hypothetical protein
MFTYLKLTFICALATASTSTPAPASAKPYGLNDLTTKAVDDKGRVVSEGAPYGVRNLRAVLDGFVYRGGANNVYPNQPGDTKRGNHNPLKPKALETLCSQGFDTAVYLYGENFKSAATETKCADGRAIKYMSLPPLDNSKNTKKILEMIHERITSGKTENKIYLHCWNGWHASGFISAITLRQFCDVPAEAAVRYWDTNTDGNNKAPRYEKVREAIRNYKSDDALKISEEQKKKFCLPGFSS